MSKEIELTNDMTAIVDDEDYDEMSSYRWHGCQIGRTAYAVRRESGRSILMSRQIMGVTESKTHVDHISGNGLDNRKCNLRQATHSQNMCNCRKFKRKCASKYKGVVRHNKPGFKKCWNAKITHNKKTRSLGYFYNEIEAALAYDEAARILFGEFARPNFPFSFENGCLEPQQEKCDE